MQEVINLPGPKTKIVEVPIPQPAEGQVLIRVIVTGTNPKDWKGPDFSQGYPNDNDGTMMANSKRGVNQGDDIAGIVEKVGKNVTEFKPGDRVAALHEICLPGGSYAEYAIAWDWATFHLPVETSFEEGATIPLCAMAAVIALYDRLKLPLPWSPATEPIPLVVYGASTAVGSFALKLAQVSNIHPIIAVAGNGIPYVKTLINESKGDIIFDYRRGSKETVQGIKKYLKTAGLPEVKHAVDTAIVEQSADVVRQVTSPDGTVAFLFPNELDVSPAAKLISNVCAAFNMDGWGDRRDLTLVFSKWFPYALRSGQLSPHPFEVRKGGLEAVEQALIDLKAGKNSATKYVVPLVQQSSRL